LLPEFRVTGIPRRVLVQDESDNITIPPADQKPHPTDRNCAPFIERFLLDEWESMKANYQRTLILFLSK
jgi:hypothetical protein